MSLSESVTSPSSRNTSSIQRGNCMSLEAPLYQPLQEAANEIRLLRIIPGGPEDDLCCTLETVSLEDIPRYYALSYVWGDATRRAQIFVNGRPVEVTENLGETLRDLRGIQTTLCDVLGVPIWIDSVCINQNDFDERSKQVSKMDQIYSNAETVIGRIKGKQSQGTYGNQDFFMAAVMTDGFREFLRYHWTNGLPLHHSQSELAKLTGYMQAILLPSIEFQDWWTRAWVVQEIVLARRDPVVIVGDIAVSWNVFTEALQLLSAVPSYLSAPNLMQEAEGTQIRALFQHLNINNIPLRPFLVRQSSEVLQLQEPPHQMYKIRETEALNKRGKLGTILTTIGRYRKASDPRDFIYAYLSFLTQEERDKIEVDYNKPPGQLYHEIMVLILLGPSENRLDVLEAFSFDHEDPSLPSWVPHFNKQDIHSRNHGQGLMSSERWLSCQSVQLSQDNKALTLRGIFFDTICEIRPVANSQEISAKEMWEISEFVTSALQRLPATEGLDLLKPDGVTIQWLGVDSFDGQHRPEIIRLWNALIQLGCPKRRADLDLTYCTENVGKVEEMLQRQLGVLQENLRRVAHGRNVVGTMSGFVGIGVPTCTEGDVIVVLEGMRGPFILRPAGTHFTIVGPAKVRGLIDNWIQIKVLSLQEFFPEREFTII